MAVLLVRHAKAGERQDWNGPDEARPLTADGRAQADGLVPTLAGFEVTRILSSPYLRCTETVEPLAAARGLEVEPSPALAEGEGRAALALARDLAAANNGDVVLCTHGDIVPEVLSGVKVALPHHLPLKKGSTWVLGVQAGRVVDARYLDPPPT